MAMTEHEQEFINALKEEFGAWGINLHPIDDEVIKEIVIASHHPLWEEFTHRLKNNLESQGFPDFDLATPEVEDIFENAQAISEFRLQKWVEN